MTVLDPAARAALLARLPALGFVPPEDAAPWARPARPERAQPRPRADVEPVTAWEPGADPAAVAAGVAAFRAAVVENEAAARRERFDQQVGWVATRLAGWSVVVVIGLATAVVVFATVCGCLGGLVR